VGHWAGRSPNIAWRPSQQHLLELAAKIEIIVRAPAIDMNGDPTYPGVVGQRLPGVAVAGYETFRSTRYGGSFEGQTSLGLGVRARLPFRVMKVGNRVVIDVAHHW